MYCQYILNVLILKYFVHTKRTCIVPLVYFKVLDLPWKCVQSSKLANKHPCLQLVSHTHHTPGSRPSQTREVTNKRVYANKLQKRLPHTVSWVGKNAATIATRYYGSAVYKDDWDHCCVEE